MRKYQQFLLIVISAVSIIILLLYKNENNRLKDVLHVVNIFGRSDEAVLKRLEKDQFTKEDTAQLGYPLPIWQALSDNYHTYAAFWNRNELVAGGEAAALVVGKRGAVVNFGCTLIYDNGQRNIRGRFQFQRVDNSIEDADSEFTSYNFFCRIERDFGHPENVIFSDITSGKHIPPEIRLRHIKPRNKQSVQSNSLTICVDMVSFNRSANIAKNETNLLQFFLHHQGIGVEDFLVYNGDAIPRHTVQLLQRFNLRLHMLPFNFPYSMTNATKRIRRLIETDCLVRNTNVASYTMLLQPNEFFYPNTKLESSRSILRSLHQYTADTKRFELPSFAVCVDRKHKLLVDSSLYDPEVSFRYKLFIYRSHVPVSTALSKTEIATSSVSLSIPMAFTHRYEECLHVGKDGLHDWRNSLQEDFIRHIQELRNELDVIL